MSTYKEIVGRKVKNVSSDPTNSAEGQMWYNTTTGTLRGLAIAEAWVAGASTATSKQRSGGCGTQTAALGMAGYTNPPGTFRANTEGYDGTSWSNFPSTANSKFNVGGGSTTTSTGSFMSGGRPGYVASTEEFTGTTETVTSKTLTTS